MEFISNADGIETTIHTKWHFFVFSENTDFISHYQNSIIDEFAEFAGKKPVLLTNDSKLNINLNQLNNYSIIHLDCSNKGLDWMLAKVEFIRSSKNIQDAFITVWSNPEWGKISIELLQGNTINEIRSINSFALDKVQYVIFSNLQNQKQILELKNLKNNLENQILERTESLTKTNKKLQAAIIQNSNINTKLHQQKLQIEGQNQEISERNSDLEKAFKKSSKQHIKLYKVLHENEQQRIELEKALKENKQTNDKLLHNNEEIVSQNEHIAQQREEIQAQRDMAIKQRDVIGVQQNEIEENITYARRIQKAMLTPKNMMMQFLPNHFVLNLPKAIVSGDFFWVAQNKNYTVVAVADCTGHGISGAMMSMLGIAFLNEIVNNNNVTKSNTILEDLRKRIILSLHQEYSHDISFSRDGMDISICVIDIVESKMEYSGANNPIYILRNDDFIELKPDKMPIGIHEFFEEPFSTKEYELEQGDTVYMFSDGYADQFGGKKGKKLKYNKFKELLIEANKFPIQNQDEFLESKFNSWKGDLEQIDDVIVLGYQIS